MIRTKAVELKTIKAYAYRQKTKDGDIGVVIVRPDTTQPGIAAISKKTGEPVPVVKTNARLYPNKAFLEAAELTRGLGFRKLGAAKVTKDMFAEEKKEETPAEEVLPLNEKALAAITAHYSDKNGVFSYDLLNKELIRFAKSSSVVRDMIAEGKRINAVRNYIVSNKFRNIAREDLSSKELKAIVEELDKNSAKGIFKDLNEELKKMMGKARKV